MNTPKQVADLLPRTIRHAERKERDMRKFIISKWESPFGPIYGGIVGFAVTPLLVGIIRLVEGLR